MLCNVNDACLELSPLRCRIAFWSGAFFWLDYICSPRACMFFLFPGTRSFISQTENKNKSILGSSVTKMSLSVDETVYGCLSCFSLCPRDRLVTCPGWPLPLTQCLLDLPELNGLMNCLFFFPPRKQSEGRKIVTFMVLLKGINEEFVSDLGRLASWICFEGTNMVQFWYNIRTAAWTSWPLDTRCVHVTCLHLLSLGRGAH